MITNCKVHSIIQEFVLNLLNNNLLKRSVAMLVLLHVNLADLLADTKDFKLDSKALEALSLICKLWILCQL